ncbi:MAG: DUF1592 domain-containing protein, partial [Verrucomicrobiota bacterium]
FQYRIASDHLEKHHPERYASLVTRIRHSKNRGRKTVNHWSNWTNQWQGPRPRIFSAEIEGPIYETWPPARQIALIGRDPKAADAARLLKPIAERAWRRTVREGELDRIVALVHSQAKTLGDTEALKEGIVAILVSPPFLLLNPEPSTPNDRFATRLSYFLTSSGPTSELRQSVTTSQLDSFASIREYLKKQIRQSKAEAFLREFPYGWLELSDINFMAPDPDHYRFYHRKRVSEDMVNEVLHFFRHIVEHNRPIPELISADYSFINADLARLYGIPDTPPDSRFRQHTFPDGRRGGLLGMGAFLTATADSLSTSPIHRAVYVMENFLGIQPTPPPPNVEITEPAVRQAKPITESLAAPTNDNTCASCHKTIDPWGYAFENFDPAGAWRDAYTVTSTASDANKKRPRKRGRIPEIPIDASAKFRNGTAYSDIIEFRKEFRTEVNRDRFVRCFITKILTFANGVEPAGTDFPEVDKILRESAAHEYRMIETLAAIVDSPLFRG